MTFPGVFYFDKARRTKTGTVTVVAEVSDGI
jgi:hypothetical protein